MDVLPDDIDAMLDLVERQGYDLQPPATEAMIAAAEARLGVAFPPSFRALLLRHNGFSAGFGVMYGVPPLGAPGWGNDMFNATESPRHNARESIELGYKDADCLADLALIDRGVAIDDGGGSGDPLWLLCGLADDRGECPVGRLDHETDRIYALYASSFPRLVGFLFDRIERMQAPEDESEEEYRWPSDEAWTVARDPELGPRLAAWRSREAALKAAIDALCSWAGPGGGPDAESAGRRLDLFFGDSPTLGTAPEQDAEVASRLVGRWAWRGDPAATLEFGSDGALRGLMLVKGADGTPRMPSWGKPASGVWRVCGGLLQAALASGGSTSLLIDVPEFGAGSALTLRFALREGSPLRHYERQGP